jgi:bacterioferritin-associated ferredoxin
MYICLCRGITDHQIKEAVNQGAHSPKALRQKLNVCTQCGKCSPDVRCLLKETLNEPEQPITDR